MIVADAGMLSETHLKALDEAGLHFIVGSRVTKAPAGSGGAFLMSRGLLHRWASD